MMMRASGRLALILATGIFVWFGASRKQQRPAQTPPRNRKARQPGKSIKQGSRDGKRSAQGKSEKAASKSSDSKKSADVADAAGNTPSALPAAVANSNAELTSAETSSANAGAGVEQGQHDADGGNGEAGRGASGRARCHRLRPAQRCRPRDAGPDPGVTAAAADDRHGHAGKAAPVLASSDSSALDQTSLIGKVFIAFGALLTMASAARMFMA